MNETSPAEKEPEFTGAKEKPQAAPWRKRVITFAWLPISFILPFLFTYQMATQEYVEIPGRTKYIKEADFRKAEVALDQGLRSGSIGVLVALAILAMWKLDAVNRKGSSDLKDRWAKLVLISLASLLWLVWTFSIYAMFRACDSINEVPAQLPGLETPQ